MTGRKKVTFDDIARHTKFSKTTISRYFNDPATLTEENRRIIADALDELGYQENKIARVLANGRTEFIGVIIPTLFYHSYAETLNKILQTYETYGYKFLVFVGTGDKEQERRYIHELLAYNIEGMIVLSHAIPSKELAATGVPIVAIEREDRCVNSVNTDNYMGGVQATSLLVKNECDMLLHVNTFLTKSVPAYGRIRGFLDVCEEQGVPHELILRKFRDSYDQVSRAMHEVYAYIQDTYPGRRKGLFMANDTYANLMLNIIVRDYHGLPDEYRIVGFDNSPIAETAIVPISTVGQQIDRLTTEAMDLLITQIRSRDSGAKQKTRPRLVHKKITPVLIRRETTT
ncbi:MAG: LacI family transcriptional regulator [Clostridia bacterium]|nr:LacI family transcriptional regulator [Clostridia bacterium]